MKITHVLMRLANDKRGVAALEYGLLTSLIAVVIIGVLTSVGSSANDMFNSIATTLANAALGNLQQG